MNTTATFNLIDGTLSNIGTQKSVALQKKDNKSFIGIMLPTEELKNKLSLTILADGGKYQYTVPRKPARLINLLQAMNIRSISLSEKKRAEKWVAALVVTHLGVMAATKKVMAIKYLKMKLYLPTMHRKRLRGD